MGRFLDPKADLTFKKVFGEHKHLVMSLLNALLPLKAGREVVSIEYLPPEMTPRTPLSKDTIADRTSTDEITLTIAGDLVLNGAVNLSVGGRAANLGLVTGFDATRFHVQNVEVSIGGDFFTPLGAVIGLFFFVV